MSSVASDLVRQYFFASSSDLTPVPVRQAIRIIYAPVLYKPELTEACESVLSNTEVQRAGRFKTPGQAALFKQRRAFRRYCGAIALGSSQPLNQISFSETKNGRPFLTDLPATWFSFSSCQTGFLGAWSSIHGIGVDLEDQATNLKATELAKLFFSTSEASVVNDLDGEERLRTFYKFWSLKEAALKSVGEGLPFGLDSFEFRLDPDPRLIQAPREYGGAEKFEAQMLSGNRNGAALVIRHLT